jgi:L-lactate dehydrogenase complex protein LldG
MHVTPSKENILKRVRVALSQPVPLPFPQAEGKRAVFAAQDEDLGILFAETFSRLLGRFVFCASDEELAGNLKALALINKWEGIYCREPQLLEALKPFTLPFLGGCELQDAAAGLTTCEALVARTGSIVLSAAQASGRTVGIFPPVHVAVAYASQLVYDIGDALKLLKKRYGEALPSMISFQTGPSRTSDIEKTSVVGVHGPREVYVFLVDSEP